MTVMTLEKTSRRNTFGGGTRGDRPAHRVMRDLAALREPLMAAHLPFPSIGRVAEAGNLFRWVPTMWEY